MYINTSSGRINPPDPQSTMSGTIRRPLVVYMTFCLTYLPCVAAQKPNIVFILADDVGWNDIGYRGSEIQTPNLDALAESGVKLENHYVQPLCSPTRGQLLTGRHQIHYGLQSNNLPAMCPCGLPVKYPTLADKLRDQGYATHIVGKWHLGFASRKYIPTSRGFDTHYGYYQAYEDYYTHVEHGYVDFHQDGEVLYDEEGYSTDLFKERTIRLLDDHTKHHPHKPMFLYLPFQSVHAPLEAPEEFINQHSFIKDEKRRIFAGMLAAIDDAVGQIKKSLMKNDMWKNTILVFSSDNGGQPKFGGNNWPLRGHKSTMFEGAIRAVSFVAGPVLPRGGVTSRDLMHVTDWFPTLLKLAGGDPSDLGLDGHDMWETLSTGKPSPRTEILHNIDPLHDLKGSRYPDSPFDNRQRAAVRVDSWKLITGDPGCDSWIPLPDHSGLNATYTTDGDDPEKNIWLFNIAKDPEERLDLADSHPHVVTRLLETLAKYEASSLAPIVPTLDKQGHPAHNGRDYWGPWLD